MLIARGAGRAWGGRVVVEDVDLEVAPGEVVALVGPNGGGKSTLLSLFAGLVRPTWGTVTVGGVPAADVALAATGSIGLVTPEPGLYPLLTGWENLRFFGALYGLAADAVDAGARPLLAALRVDEAALGAPVAGWSSGTRQKVSLARALLLAPPVLLLDEPTSNLDPVTARILYAAVRARADAGAAVVVATHDLHAAEHVCDRVLGIDRRVVGIHRLAGARAAPPASPLLALFPGEEPEASLLPPALAGAGRGGGAGSPSARILAVARREWLEQRRQPGMLAAIGTLYAVVAAAAVVGVLALDYVHRRAAGAELVGRLLASTPEALAASTVGAYDFLAFTQLLGIAAVAGGHALLHDRHCGTLVFLLLAPVRRIELLVGKVVGAIGWPVLLYAGISGGAAVGVAAVPIARHTPELTAASSAFWVAFALGAPAWAALLGAVGTMLSALARDVRGAQQGVWFVVFFASLLAGGLLTWGLSAGVAAELGVAALGATAAAAVVVGGAQVSARDIRRS